MTPIQESIINKKTKNKPIWLMRQAGRYLPEFRKIRKLNPNFINLCLNENLSSKITLQPLKRFKLDAAIIFSDILMIPYGLNQKVRFKKNFGPALGSINLDKISNINEIDFLKKLDPIYKSIKKVKKNILTNNKDIIGFIGAPWTLLVYMINKHSPKKKLIRDFFKDKSLIKNSLQSEPDFEIEYPRYLLSFEKYIPLRATVPSLDNLLGSIITFAEVSESSMFVLAYKID